MWQLCEHELLDPTTYLAGTPPDFIDCADVLLVLKDRKKALAHRAVLASHSAVLSTMLAHLADTGEAPGKKLELPLSAYDKKECTAILSCLYSKHLRFNNVEAAILGAEFGHKFDAPAILQSAEAHLVDFVASTFEEDVSTRLMRSIAWVPRSAFIANAIVSCSPPRLHARPCNAIVSCSFTWPLGAAWCAKHL